MTTEHYPLVANITHFDEPESKPLTVADEGPRYRPEAIVGWCALLVALYGFSWLAWHARAVIEWVMMQ